MFERLLNLWNPPNNFKVTSPTPGLASCDMRSVRRSDFDRCEDVYRANEKLHFPAGYFGTFSSWLRREAALIVVAERDGVVIAFGGLSAQDFDGQPTAVLSYGMVDPALHRQGYGSALLLARLALLRTDRPAVVLLSAVHASQSFYKRFGFKHRDSRQATPTYREDWYSARLTPRVQGQCAAILRGRVNLSADLTSRQVPNFGRFDKLAPIDS